MTCREMFILQLKMFIPLILDNLAGVLIAFSVIMILICFFGKEGKLTKKSSLPLTIFFMFFLICYVIVVFYEFFALRKTWNEPYQEGMLLVQYPGAPIGLCRFMFYSCIFLSAMLTFSKKRIRTALLTMVMTIGLIGYVMLETTYSVSFFFDDPRQAMVDMTNINDYVGQMLDYICVIVSTFICLIIFLALYFGMIKKSRTMYINWKYRVLFIIWESLMIGLILMAFISSDAIYEKCIRYELGVIMPIIGFVVPFMLISIISRRYVVEKSKIQENYIAAELDYLNQYKKDQNETRAFRREIKNNLASLSTLYSNNNIEEAGEQLKLLLGNIKAMSPKYITGDEMLDCIVGMKTSKMEEEKIDFIIDGVVDGGLGMKPVDICSIFANAMDNAIEACEKLPEKNEKWIKLAMKKTDRFFSVTLSNTMVEEGSIAGKLFGDGERVTTKKDRSLHGFGTQNMKATISKYDGIEKVSAKDGVFTLTILIPRNM